MRISKVVPVISLVTATVVAAVFFLHAHNNIRLTTISALIVSSDGKWVVATRLDAERMPVRRKFLVGPITRTISAINIRSSSAAQVIDQFTGSDHGSTGTELLETRTKPAAFCNEYGKLLVVDSSHRTVRYYDILKRKWGPRFDAGLCDADFIEISPDKKVLLTGRNGVLKFWNASSGAMLGSIPWEPVLPWEQYLVISKTHILACYFARSGLQFIDLDHGGKPSTVRFHDSKAAVPLEFSPADNAIAISVADGVVLFDMRSGKTRPIGPRAWGELFRFSPDGGKAAALKSSDTIWVIDVSTGAVVNELRNESEISALAWLPHGDELVFGDRHGNLKLWKVLSRSLPLAISVPGAP